MTDSSGSTPSNPASPQGPAQGPKPTPRPSGESSAADSAKQKAADLIAEAKQKAADAAEKAKAAAAEATEKAKQTAGTVKDKATDATPPLTKPLTTPPTSLDKTPAAGVPVVPVVETPDEPSLGQLVSTATEAVSTLVRSEIELAKLELRSTVKNGLTGAGAFVGALVLLVFSLIFGLIFAAEGLIALGLDRWLGYLVVFAALLLGVGVLVFVGIKKVKSVRAPEKTIRTTKETVDYLKSQRG